MHVGGHCACGLVAPNNAFGNKQTRNKQQTNKRKKIIGDQTIKIQNC